MEKACVVRGRPKSGRLWKTVRTQKYVKYIKFRYSANKQPKGIKKSFAERQALKAELEKRRSIDAERKQKRAEMKQERRLQQEKKKEIKNENIRKSEIVVPIKNAAKIKKMKKSQLRTIEKR